MALTLDDLSCGPRDDQSQKMLKLFFQACLDMYAVNVELVHLRDDQRKSQDVLSKLLSGHKRED